MPKWNSLQGNDDMKYTSISARRTTIREVCGQRWPRLMEVEDAAAYVGLTAGTFKKRFPQLIRPYTGEKPAVAKEDLDAMIDAEKARLDAESEAANA